MATESKREQNSESFFYRHCQFSETILKQHVGAPTPASCRRWASMTVVLFFASVHRARQQQPTTH